MSHKERPVSDPTAPSLFESEIQAFLSRERPGIERWTQAAGEAVRAEVERAVVQGLSEALRRLADDLPRILAAAVPPRSADRAAPDAGILLRRHRRAGVRRPSRRYRGAGGRRTPPGAGRRPARQGPVAGRPPPRAGRRSASRPRPLHRSDPPSPRLSRGLPASRTGALRPGPARPRGRRFPRSRAARAGPRRGTFAPWRSASGAIPVGGSRRRLHGGRSARPGPAGGVLEPRAGPREEGGLRAHRRRRR